MMRTRSQKRNQTPQLSEFLAEIKQKAGRMTPPEEVVIQKAKFANFKIPRVRLSDVHERVLNPVVPRELTPLEQMHAEIKSGDAKKSLKPTVIVIDDD